MDSHKSQGTFWAQVSPLRGHWAGTQLCSALGGTFWIHQTSQRAVFFGTSDDRCSMRKFKQAVMEEKYNFEMGGKWLHFFLISCQLYFSWRSEELIFCIGSQRKTTVTSYNFGNNYRKYRYHLLLFSPRKILCNILQRRGKSQKSIAYSWYDIFQSSNLTFNLWKKVTKFVGFGHNAFYGALKFY